MDREFRFLTERDRKAYLEAYGAVQQRWDWETYSYVLMSSHVHFGNKAGILAPDRVFRSVHTRAARHFHSRGDTLGPVFADRPKLYEVPDEALPRLVAYHHRNPVSAKVVKRAIDSPWTSHRAYLRLEPAPDWLDVEKNLALLGFSDTPGGRAEFDDFVNDIDLSEPIPYEPWTESQEPLIRPGNALLSDEAWTMLLVEAAAMMNCTVEQLRCSQGHTASRGRRLVAQLALDLGQSFEDIGRHLGRSSSSVHRLVHRPPKDPKTLSRQLEDLRRQLARRLSDWPRVDRLGAEER